MRDATLPLCDAIVTALRANSGVTALASTRTYDRAAQSVTYPFVSLGPTQALPFGRADHNGCDVYLQIDIWSRGIGTVEAKRIQAAVIAALDMTTPAVTGYTLHSLRAAGGQTMTDPDNLTTHAMVNIHAVLTPAS